MEGGNVDKLTRRSFVRLLVGAVAGMFAGKAEAQPEPAEWQIVSQSAGSPRQVDWGPYNYIGCDAATEDLLPCQDLSPREYKEAAQVARGYDIFMKRLRGALESIKDEMA